ncbi:nucleotide sugar dehydrogenase [Alkaliphilus pronyensis]|uniref:Nucleotide sugar dehydrogenase n=1 Tax=Alkaliphilus pronyensis TaxID=1482732 RepID=A0A6I0FDI7_9FIRM|nr:nucleotide sugar dehydrogenase [Alkaliphilus pronyensis]KAB3537316.1 nucleotide sugar dehydrogenase [Alkaliphilus pronyensis]
MKDLLKNKILNRDASIAIIGLGYVGLPLAYEAAKAGFNVIGIDHNEDRLREIHSGNCIIIDAIKEEFKELVKTDRIKATKDYRLLKTADIIIICVPTGLTKNLTPDLVNVEDVTKEIAKNIRVGQLISIESTIYPGTTEEVVLPLLEASGLKVEEDFLLCHSPERIDPGNLNYSTKNISKVIGGIGAASLEVGKIFYSQIINNIVGVSSVKAAELSKVHENTFRAINIALVNELAVLCDKMMINVWEVLEAAFTKPFGIMEFYPGPGVGGHCIPIDPHYLEFKAREYNFMTKFISLAGEVNRKMPEFVREKVLRALNKIGITPTASKVLIIGMAYKKDTGDYRESPAISIAELLLKDGIKLSYYDPYINKIEIGSHSFSSISLNDEAIKAADVVLITTDHSIIDYSWLIKTANLIIDTRNATKGLEDKENKVILL